MAHRFAILLAASLSLLAAPALGDDAPGGSAPSAPAAPPFATPAPSTMSVPPPWAYGPPGGYVMPPPRPVMERYSTPMMATGIALVSGGVTGLLVGATVFANKSSCVIAGLPPDAGIPDRCPGDPHHFIGGTIMIASGVIAALGVPLWVAGARRVPIDPPIEGENHARLAPHSASASPRLAPFASATLLLGPTSTGVRLTF